MTTPDINAELLKFRDQIDDIDQQMLILLNKRASLAQSIGHVKAKTDAPVMRPEREAQVLDKLNTANTGPLSSQHIHTLFKEIMSACRSSGIAVGMATNMPPHNLKEVVAACLYAIDAPECTVDDLIELIPAPDFPTAGIIYGIQGVREGYRTGRGRVVMRAKTHFEDMDKGGRQSIIVDELPYQVNKKTLLERIAELVSEKKIEGISDIRSWHDLL